MKMGLLVLEWVKKEGWARKFFDNLKASLKWQRMHSFEKFAVMIESTGSASWPTALRKKGFHWDSTKGLQRMDAQPIAFAGNRKLLGQIDREPPVLSGLKSQ